MSEVESRRLFYVGDAFFFALRGVQSIHLARQLVCGNNVVIRISYDMLQISREGFESISRSLR